MTRPFRPEVSDPELRAVLGRVGPQIENHTQNLDLLSKDIRSVEQYLSDSGVRLAAAVTIGYEEDFVGGDYDVFGSYSGPMYRDLQRIEWAPEAPDAKRWRVIYSVVRRRGEIHVIERLAYAGPTFTGQPEERERKPLIETPVAVRLKAHKYLAQLIEEVGKLVEYTPTTVPANTDDIPF